MRSYVLAAALAAAVGGPGAMAQTAPSPEARALIEKQLDAFSHDDAAGAYAEASPQLHEIFPDPDAFLSMVRRGYAPVYRHRSVEFGAATMEGDDMQQDVVFVDEQGKAWKATYKLSRQPDGSWLISGCSLAEIGSSA